MPRTSRRAAKTPSKDDIARLYRGLFLIRRAEEEVEHVYPSDKIKSPVHLAIGQEAVSVAICDALRPDDVLGCTYRSHAAYLAKGGDLGAMMAEMYGKATGCARGKGGSMHLVDMQHLLLGASAVVGTGIPIAAGYAIALKREKKRRVAVTLFGDGATEEGCFYETLNFAGLHKLPLLFVCENNFYSIHTHISKRWSNLDVCGRARAFGVPAKQIVDGDIFKIRAAAAAAVDRIRRGGGPEFLEIHTYRWRQHVGPGGDYDAGYRSEREARKWMKSDQVARLAAMLASATRVRIEDEVNAKISEAIAFAESSPFPGPEDLLADVFAD
ncbi:MAG: thiamine pyrophosphate-dependent dehydrogenase E1 component subunit alpha [Rhodospirillales bacterium]|nr:thiamine pyrophosphate-dependent dehydrogenase E1 component subunit alpha [Rhodospirillales bacterium]